MKRGRTAALIPGLLLAGFYGYRAVIGVVAGQAWDQGIHEILTRDYESAAEMFGKATVGGLKYDMQRRTGDARIDIWEADADSGGPFDADANLLPQTAGDYMQALCTAPAARHPWLGLALVYQKLEWMGRERRSEQGFESGVEPWSRVGRSGRVAIGMARRAIERSPNYYLQHDWLARTYWLFGLESETREAIRRTALALPLYFRHEYGTGLDLPEWTYDVFYETSRETVGRTPLLPRASHLVDLGKLARDRGRYDDALVVLNEALEIARDPLVQAEARFNLGLSLVLLERYSEGREQLTLSAEHPVFYVPSLNNLVMAAERSADYEAALVYLRELRREKPRDLNYCMRSARLARKLQDWPVALEALQWARIVAPSDPRSSLGLIETYLEMGDLSAARTEFRELEGWAADSIPPGLRDRLAEY